MQLTETQRAGVEFFDYHLGCGKSNRMKAVTEVAVGTDPLPLPTGGFLTGDNPCNGWGMAGLGLAYLFGAGVTRDYEFGRKLMEVRKQAGGVSELVNGRLPVLFTHVCGLCSRMLMADCGG